MNRAKYARLAEGRDRAMRGRALRLLGRVDEAVAALEGLDSPAARAYLWDAGAAPASVLDLSDPWWRAWAALAALDAAPERTLELCDGAAPDLPLRGLALMRLRRWEEAAAALDADEAWILRQRSRALLRLGDVEGFVETCSRSILLDEGIGDLAAGLGRLESHAPAGIVAAARGRTEWWALALRGDCKRSPEVDDKRGGLADLLRAAELAPERAWVWAYLGRARDSEDDLSRAVSLAPESGWPRIWRGELKRKRGALREALSDFDAGLRLAADYDLGYSWRGAALLALGRVKEAAADLELAAALLPGHAWTHEQLSQCYNHAVDRRKR